MMSSSRLLKVIFGLVAIILILGSCSKKADTAPSKSSANLISSFTVDNLTPAVNGNIDQANLAINLTVPSGTNVTNLVAAVAISDKATVSPSVGSAVNFTNVVNYTVTAEDGSKRTYKVTVTKAKSDASLITEFKFINLTPIVNASINSETKTITATVPYSANLSNLTPSISISDKATITPKPEVSTDFSKEVSYTVTAESGKAQVYKVNIDRAGPPVTLLTKVIDKTISHLGRGYNTEVFSAEYNDKRLVKVVGTTYFPLASSSPFIQRHVFNYDVAGKLISTDITYEYPANYTFAKPQAVRSAITYNGDNISNIKTYLADNTLATQYNFVYNNGRLTAINDIELTWGADQNVVAYGNYLKSNFDAYKSIALTLPHWEYFYTQTLFNTYQAHPTSFSFVNGIFNLLPSANNLLKGWAPYAGDYSYTFDFWTNAYPSTVRLNYWGVEENYAFEYTVVK